MNKIEFTYIPFTSGTMIPETIKIINKSTFYELEIDDKSINNLFKLVNDKFKIGKFDNYFVRLRLRIKNIDYYIDAFGVVFVGNAQYYISPRSFLELSEEMNRISEVELPAYWKRKNSKSK